MLSILQYCVLARQPCHLAFDVAEDGGTSNSRLVRAEAKSFINCIGRRAKGGQRRLRGFRWSRRSHHMPSVGRGYNQFVGDWVYGET